MKKILISLLSLILVIGLVGLGVFAYFSDTETSSGNVFTAGTLDLKVDGQDGISQKIYLTNLEPGDTGRSVIGLKNIGTLGNYLTLSGGWPLAEADGTEPTGFEFTHDVSANEFASTIHITLMVYAVDSNDNGQLDQEEIDAALAWPGTGCDYIDGPDDDIYDYPGNKNGMSDLYDFCKFFHAPQGAVTTWDGDGFFVFDWEFMPDPANWMGNVNDTSITDDNDFQADGVEFELVFKLWQN